MQCKSCGAQVESMYRLCPFCGTELDYAKQNVIVNNYYGGTPPEEQGFNNGGYGGMTALPSASPPSQMPDYGNVTQFTGTAPQQQGTFYSDSSSVMNSEVPPSQGYTPPERLFPFGLFGKKKKK